MKSSFELAMERLNKASPAVKFTADQKKKLAELDAKYAAKVAEREIALKDEIRNAEHAGEGQKAEELRQQLVFERKKIQSELEDKKELFRQGKL